MRIHVGGHIFVLKTLVLHDMAPMAGAVANAQQDGLVFCTGPLQRLLTPGVPVHGIVGVLQQVRALFVLQVIHSTELQKSIDMVKRSCDDAINLYEC